MYYIKKLINHRTTVNSLHYLPQIKFAIFIKSYITMCNVKICLQLDWVVGKLNSIILEFHFNQMLEIMEMVNDLH